MKQVDLKALFDVLSPGNKELVLALRNVVHRTVPQAKEYVVKHGQVRLDFIHGVRLTDPSGLLQGNRLSKRFVPIETVGDAERAEVANLIREAAALDLTEWS
jgi:hypothetical protein